MVLYGPRLVSSACSWAHRRKHRKAEGRKAILLGKSHLLGGPFCTCVKNQPDPEPLLSFLQGEVHGIFGAVTF